MMSWDDCTVEASIVLRVMISILALVSLPLGSLPARPFPPTSATDKERGNGMLTTCSDNHIYY